MPVNYMVAVLLLHRSLLLHKQADGVASAGKPAILQQSDIVGETLFQTFQRKEISPRMHYT